jgi:sulfur-carrier protein
MPTLVLPTSLTQLFPGTPRRVEVTAGNVAEALDQLEARWPGMRARLCDTPATLRRHITVFVDSHQADLATPLGPVCEVRIVPALSGG